MKRISIIIPALNEPGSIGCVVAEMPWDRIAECIVVDNGSTDGTGRLPGGGRAGRRVGAGVWGGLQGWIRRGTRRQRHSGVHGWRRIGRDRRPQSSGGADRVWRGRLRHRFADSRDARAGKHAAQPGLRGLDGGPVAMDHAAGAVHRHGLVSGDPASFTGTVHICRR
jgi:hypothetical protein